MVLEIEVQGARQVRAAMPEAVQVFIAPPSLEALRTRLIGRGTDDPQEVERRLRVAEQELAAQPEFAPRGRQRPARRGARRSSTRDRRRARCALTAGRRRDAASRGALHCKANQERRATVISPRIDRLLEHVDSNYAGVIVAAKRARQINSYYHNLGEGTFDEFPPPMIDTALEKLPHDRPRGGSSGEDEVPLPLARHATRGQGLPARAGRLQPLVMAGSCSA